MLDNPEADFINDFDIRKMNIIPVANPEISSKIQRIQQAQTELSQFELVAATGGDTRVIVKNFYEAIGAQNVNEIFPDEDPQQQLQRLLGENPELAELISGEAERLDLIAASQADALEREEARKDAESERKDAETASKLDKEESETEKNKSATILNLEKAETEDLQNQISTYTAVGTIDNQALQNQQVLQQLQQPQELTIDNTNQARSTRLESQPSDQSII